MTTQEVLRKHYDAYMSTFPSWERDEYVPFDEMINDPDVKAILPAMQEYADQEVRPYELAITSLTPGGSEYVNDPKACVDFVRADRERQHEFIVKQAIQIKELKAELAELRDGISGIANWSGEMCGWPDAGFRAKGTAQSILSKHKP